jgi:hypothetical protein
MFARRHDTCVLIESGKRRPIQSFFRFDAISFPRDEANPEGRDVDAGFSI